MPDVVVCNIAMTTHDGYWFLAAVRRIPGAANLPVIAVTRHGDVHPAERTLSAGFSSHVRKPIDPWELTRLVDAHTRTRS